MTAPVLRRLAPACGFCLLCPLFAQEVGRAAFDARLTLNSIKDLASDAMLGRKSGQPGGVLAEEYVASRLKQWGIAPGGEKGTYFQTFTFPQNHIVPGVKLELLSGRESRPFGYEDGWRVWPYSGSGDFTSEVVFAGYGIHAPELGYDDLAGLNLKGKLALIALDMPQKLADRLQEKADIRERFRFLQAAGARGVLYPSIQSRAGRTVPGDIDENVYRPDFVILRVETKLTDFIFKDLPTEWNALIEEIDAAAKPRSLATGVRAKLKVRAFFNKKAIARNVLGIIPGSDDRLKNEAIIIAAHADHIGLSPRGEVMNGANDNASGTAVALEAARVLQLNEPKPKRSVIFFLWAAEEQGFQGLRHYCRNPLFPLDKTAAYITMDMVGHGSGKVRVSGREYRPDLWALLQKNVSPSILEYIIPSDTFSPRVPPFEELMPTGIARIGLLTDGRHIKFHQGRDDADLIQPDLLKRTGDFIVAAAEVLGNSPENLIPPFRKEDYYLKIVRLINFGSSPLREIAASSEKLSDGYVNVQLGLLQAEDSLKGDSLRVRMTKELRAFTESVKRSRHITLFSSTTQLDAAIRSRKLSVCPGLDGLAAVRDDPEWLEILAEQGLLFVRENNPGFLFGEEGLNGEGRRLIEAIQSCELLFMLGGMDSTSAKALLKEARHPVVLMARELPDGETLGLIQKTRSALGLIWGAEEMQSYFQKLDAVKKAVGSGSVMIVPEESILGEGKKDGLMRLTAQMLMSGYEWTDLLNLFSGAFLRVLEEAKNP